MIIERIQQTLIMRVRRTNTLGTGDAETEENRHVVVDQGSAYSVEVPGRQNIQQGRAGDQAMISGAVREEALKCLDTAVDDHRVLRQRQRSTDGRVMIKMDPALLKGKARRQPPLVGSGSGTEIDDLQDTTSETTGVNKIIDQLGEEGADRGGAPRGVGGGPGGKPARVNGDSGRRFR
jgi:hypothetical protein